MVSGIWIMPGNDLGVKKGVPPAGKTAGGAPFFVCAGLGIECRSGSME
jgi:hypothetical protein